MSEHAQPLFHAKTAQELQELDRGVIERALSTQSLACIRGLVSPAQVLAARERIVASFKAENDLPPQGVSPAVVQTNCQKLTVTGASVRNNSTPRVVRTFFNPTWSEDVYGLRSAFASMIAVRNYLQGLPLDFAYGKIESNGLWTASRVHHYPKGGGFFASHTDWVTADVAEQSGLPFFQLILVMSKKGKDFTHGGGFVETASGRLYVEEEFELGDIAIYDGRTLHGVEDIDPFDRMDTNSPAGRYAGFVTLYKDMKSADEVDSLKWQS